MIVTNVKIKKVDGDKLDRLKAYVDITLDESLVIHGLRTRIVCSNAIKKNA